MVSTASAFLELCPHGVLAGVDLGKRWIGLALSDASRIVAMPLGLVKVDGADWPKKVLQALAPYRPAGWVVGWPLTLEGRAGRQCQSVRDSAKRLYNAQKTPLLFWDERFTSHAAQEFSFGGAREDAWAACILLDDCLKAMRF